ncbi:MAG: DegT/DnrJ/EryC1/StrS family aminotransferase [Candidatus Xenobium sp.]|jgi:perosamine synthetase
MPTSEQVRVPVARPWLGEEEVEALRRPLLSGWVTQGPEVASFEAEFASAVGAPHACAVANCTVALQLALRAAGVGAGDEVVTVSHSFIATANSIRYQGGIPVFVDVEPGGVNMDPDRVAEALGPRTKALLVVHQLGMPADLGRLLPLARRHGIPVIEDAACAVGSEIEGQPLGMPHGDACCFSFHPRKLLTTGDGGMITTRHPEWDRRFRLWRQHSMSVNDQARHGSNEVIFESYEELGYNYRMTDLQAAVGRVQLRRLEEILRVRRAQIDRYQELLKGTGLILPQEPSWGRTNWQSYLVRLPEGVDQKGFMQRLLDRGISTRRGVMCAHLEPAYWNEPWRCTGRLPGCDHAHGICPNLRHSEEALKRGVILPAWHDLPGPVLERVAREVREALAG